MFVSHKGIAFFVKEDHLAILDQYNIHFSQFYRFSETKSKSKKSLLY